jgi:hypothetical protein
MNADSLTYDNNFLWGLTIKCWNSICVSNLVMLVIFISKTWVYRIISFIAVNSCYVHDSIARRDCRDFVKVRVTLWLLGSEVCHCCLQLQFGLELKMRFVSWYPSKSEPSQEPFKKKQSELLYLREFNQTSELSYWAQ